MYKIFKNSILKVLKESVLSIVFVALESAFEIVIPLVMAKLIDKGLQNLDMSAIVRYGIIIIMLVVFEAAFGTLCAIFAIKASTGFAKDIRERVFSKLQIFAFANIDKFSTGSLVTRSTTDISNVQRAFMMVIRGTIRALSMLVFSLVISYSINYKIALTYTIIMPIVLLSFLLFSRLAMPYFEKMFSSFDNLNNVISEDIHGMRVVKTFNQEEFEFKKMKSVSDIIYKYSLKAESYIALWDPFMNVALYTIIILTAWFGAKAIIASGNNPDIGLTTGNLMSLLTYGIEMLVSLMMISFIFVMLIISRASIKRLYEVLVEETKIKNPENPIYEVKDGSIDFNNVYFKYTEESKNMVLKDINLHIKSGEMIGLIGGTGSGKSSLVSIIPRLYDVSDGELLVGGVNVKNYDLNTLRKEVGIVLQKNKLFSGTIASNLRFGNENATYEDMEKACDIAGALEFINNLPDKFESVVEQDGTNFSGGQRQRLSIARTILKNSKIIIFDDSTSAVDTKTDAKIRKGLKESLSSTTKIIISQRIISLIDCDRIMVIDDGKLIAFDTHENLLKTCSLYKDINDIQNS